MSSTIVCDLIYSGSKRGHGGEHRSAQIKDILEKLNFPCFFLPLNEDISNIAKYIIGFYAAIKYIRIPNISWRWIRRWGANYYRYHKNLIKIPGSKTFLIENNRPSNLIAFHYVNYNDYKIIAVPQNIECFEHTTKNPTNPSIPFRRLKYELMALKKAEATFCISNEEAWFLSFENIKSLPLPYYPPPDLIDELNSIRRLRLSKQFKNEFLIMGSATNPYTKSGIWEVLNILNQKTKNDSYKIHIVGSGTDELKKYFHSEAFIFHGKASQEYLKQLLSEVKAMIIHQPFGAGALTRIPEMLIAGVPLITNFVSARSYHHYDGIYTYYTNDQLYKLMQRIFECPSEPEYPYLEVQTFTNFIKKFVK